MVGLVGLVELDPDILLGSSPEKTYTFVLWGADPNFFGEENPAASREPGCDVSKERFRDSRSYSALAQTAIPSPKNDSRDNRRANKTPEK